MLISNEVVFDGRVMRAADALAQHHEVEVLGWLRPGRDEKRVAELGTALPFRVRLVRLAWSVGLPKNLLGYACRFAELFLRFLALGVRRKPWLVYAHELDALPVGWLIAMLTGARLVWDSHELYPDQADHFINRTPRRRRWGIRLQRALMQRCDGIIACNRQRAEIMYREYGAPFLPAVVRNVPPFGAPVSGDTRLRAFVQERNPRIRRLIVHTGGIIGRAEVIIPALVLLPPDIGLVIIGYADRNLSPRISALLRQHNVEDRVFAHPQVPYAELRAVIGGADLGLVSYTNTCRNNYYCAPSKLHEYAMAGVPVVAVDFPPCREILSEYRFGLCFTWNDPADLAAKIRACLENEAVHRRMCQEALRAARAINWETERPRLVAAIDAIARRTSPGGRRPSGPSIRASDPGARTRRGPGRGKLRVAVVYRVCQHWRLPVFRRLDAAPDMEVTVFHGRDVPGTKLINTQRFDGLGHREHFTLRGRVVAGGRVTPWVFCPFIWWSLMRHDPDVILAEGGSNVLTNLLVYAYARLWGKPVVWWTLGEVPGREFRGIRRLYRRVVEAMERAADALLGYSSVALDYFRRMGYPPEKCFRAVNCVDTDRVFRDIEQGRERVPLLRQRLGLTNRRVVLFVGALTAEKRIDRLLRAFAHVRRSVPGAFLLLVGDGPDRARLERLTAELEIAPDTLFAGQIIEGVSDYYELADVFVLPGLGGLAVSEALAHGLPVVCTRGDGCEVDLVQPGVTGFRIDEADDATVVQRIAERVSELLSNGQQLQAMREAARRLIRERYNVHTYVAEVARAIRYAYGAGRRRATRERRP